MNEYNLNVFSDRSEIVYGNGQAIIFAEGPMSDSARSRYQVIKTALQQGFLSQEIETIISKPEIVTIDGITTEQISIIDSLVDSVTSEVGRALVGLTVLQLTIKTIAPEQSIRLHKGGISARDFSWREGVSMRSLDKSFITPVLRHYGLLRLNADGFMMTRSLAENYPYSKLYKANLRGARTEWLSIVEDIELGELNPELALRYLLSRLVNGAGAFTQLADDAITALDLTLSSKQATQSSITEFIQKHFSTSPYSARLMEISMHSLMQAKSELGFLNNLELVPLSQMRSANKKHGNVGDIEVTNEDKIIKSWDSKYGKTELIEEIRELGDKLEAYPGLELAGFVTSSSPKLSDEVLERVNIVQKRHNVIISIQGYEDWVNEQFNDADSSTELLAESWLRAYVESLAQKRRDIAPIDEPCSLWLSSIKEMLT
jgi:hypothetical protein